MTVTTPQGLLMKVKGLLSQVWEFWRTIQWVLLLPNQLFKHPLTLVFNKSKGCIVEKSC